MKNKDKSLIPLVAFLTILVLVLLLGVAIQQRTIISYQEYARELRALNNRTVQLCLDTANAQLNRERFKAKQELKICQDHQQMIINELERLTKPNK